MTRRLLLLAAVSVSLRADDADDVWEIVGRIASALSEGNATEIVSAFDRRMAGYDRLRESVTALVRDNEITATIDFVSNDGDDRARTLESDWHLRIVRRVGAASVERQQRVTAKFEKQGKRWKIVSFEPLALLTS